MRYSTAVISASIVAIATGCATTVSNGPKARAISYEEASAYEKTLQARATPSPKLPDPMYVQPINKREPCKLPTSSDQLERTNFRTYWDGQCKDGFAFGLGRDIALSDTHHVEEVSSYNGAGDNTHSPRVTYDFVNNSINYVTPGEQYPAAVLFREEMSSNGNEFNIIYSFGVMDRSGNNLYTQYSPFSTTRIFVNDGQNVVYRFIDNTSMPVVDASAVTFKAEIFDPQTKTTGGVAIVRDGAGFVRQMKLGAASPELVSLPVEYTNNLNGKLKAVQVALMAGQGSLQRAKQIEREYLYMACNGKHTVEGLDKATATKICDWRSKFKPAYDKSLANFTNGMEQSRKRAEVAKQQRLAQQQVNTQQRLLQEQKAQQGFQLFTNALAEFGQQMQNAGQQTFNSMKQPSNQVDFSPFKPLGSGTAVTCMKVTDTSAYCRE